MVALGAFNTVLDVMELNGYPTLAIESYDPAVGTRYPCGHYIYGACSTSHSCCGTSSGGGDCSKLNCGGEACWRGTSIDVNIATTGPKPLPEVLMRLFVFNITVPLNAPSVTVPPLVLPEPPLVSITVLTVLPVRSMLPPLPLVKTTVAISPPASCPDGSVMKRCASAAFPRRRPGRQQSKLQESRCLRFGSFCVAVMLPAAITTRLSDSLNQTADYYITAGIDEGWVASHRVGRQR